jgi:two-component system, NtrC family, response regulator AtoC
VTDFGLFQTNDGPMTKILESARALALTPAPILISGENGVGKNLMVQFIIENAKHLRSVFRFNSIRQNLNSLQDGDVILLESIEDLNVLQQTEVSELMDSLKIKGVKVRWLATSSLGPAELLKTGAVRKDLFYRLSVLHFEIPALRNRRCDIVVLAEFFARVFGLMKSRSGLTLSPTALQKLLSYGWPGNVAELENVIERAVALCASSVISDEFIQFVESAESHFVEVGATLSEMEKKLILQTLQMTAQNRTKAAHILGISIRTLRNKLNEYREAGAL